MDFLLFVRKLEYALALTLALVLALASVLALVLALASVLALVLALALALALEFGVLHPHLLWQTHVVYRHEFDGGCWKILLFRFILMFGILGLAR